MDLSAMPFLSLVSSSITDYAPFSILLPGLFSPVLDQITRLSLFSQCLLAHYYAGLKQFYEHSFVLNPSSS
jgi:hypothetical protein